MNILFTICARAGSKGLKNKNIRELAGKPLVYYTLEVISEFIEKNKYLYENIVCAVNTDSTELFNQVDHFGIEYIKVKRKDSDATDIAPKISAIRDTFFSAKETLGIDFDVVIDLDLTSPLRRVGDVENSIEKLLEDKHRELVFSVVEARRNPYFNMVMKTDKGFRCVNESNFTARQQAPNIYDMNASIYVYGKNFMSDVARVDILQSNCDIVIMQDFGVLDIDSEKDFKLIENIILYNNLC